jgi:hypothetical protein
VVSALARLNRSPYRIQANLFFISPPVKTVSLLTDRNSGLIFWCTMSKQSLYLAVEMAGGQVSLARGIRALIPNSKISQVHVWGWLNCVQMEVPPPETVVPICKFLGWRMTPHQLRPDIYPNPSDALPPGFNPDQVSHGDTPAPAREAA